ncbi:hypothetical protein GCM10023156_60180 [Novipirellula rosea]|uniref:Uncharacterized protein n=1 Tax=Novipirellula rosea TaxID=1031540 RepID=A0ABP8NNI9_9BACT
MWLDSGDIDGIDSLWSTQFIGLTTNNTLLNKEVQNGIYDDLVPKAAKLVEKLPEDFQVRETAVYLEPLSWFEIGAKVQMWRQCGTPYRRRQ